MSGNCPVGLSASDHADIKQGPFGEFAIIQGLINYVNSINHPVYGIYPSFFNIATDINPANPYFNVCVAEMSVYDLQLSRFACHYERDFKAAFDDRHGPADVELFAHREYQAEIADIFFPCFDRGNDHRRGRTLSISRSASVDMGAPHLWRRIWSDGIKMCREIYFWLPEFNDNIIPVLINWYFLRFESEFTKQLENEIANLF